MTLLAGLHDREGAFLVPAGGWCLDTVALSEAPAAPDYGALASGVNWIVRLNWGYGSTGTLPPGGNFAAFAKRCADYVVASRGCTRWVIGNETNLPREWANGQPISPQLYAEFYLACREAIHAVAPGHEVLVAAPGPWNTEYKYATNPDGDWLVYLGKVLSLLRGNLDGVAIHAYTHGYDPALATSDAKMDAPYQDRYYHFRTYRDFLGVLRIYGLARTSVYITEANGDGPWQATGLMPAMLREIGEWNASGQLPVVRAVVFFRYPDYDQYGMVSKPDVLREFATAAPHFPGPDVTAQAAPSHIVNIPSIPNAQPAPQPQPPRIWDLALGVRGVKIETPTDARWAVSMGRWIKEDEAGGRHHILVDVLDEQGARMVGVPLLVTWPGGSHRIVTEAKPGEPFSANYPMSPSRNEFSIRVDDGQPSELVTGLGMGADTPGGFNAGIHTSTALHFRRVAQSTRPVSPPQPVPAPVDDTRAQVPPLVHPVADPALRVVSQPFGVNPEAYARFGMAGHNGVDFAVPMGTPIVAVADGVVIETEYDADGYGMYVKVRHPWGESLYAHLLGSDVIVGDPVFHNLLIGHSGNTGNSTGPHLHFGMRINPYMRGAPFDGYSDPLPYLQQSHAAPGAAQGIPQLIAQQARIAGVDGNLLASLVWAESSFNPKAKSPVGAMGLCQIVPATWAEWAPKVGATDPWDARQNLAVGAAYLAWLLGMLKSEWAALVAFNWGIGNVLAGGDPPAETAQFANKIIHGADLLDALTK